MAQVELREVGSCKAPCLQAVQWLPVGDALVIFFTYPLVTCVMAAVVLGDRFTSLDVATGLAAAAGVVLVAQPPLMGFASRDDDNGGDGGISGGGGGSIPTHASYGAGVAAALCAAFLAGQTLT